VSGLLLQVVGKKRKTRLIRRDGFVSFSFRIIDKSGPLANFGELLLGSYRFPQILR